MAVAGVIISAIALLIALCVTVLITVLIHDHRHLFDCVSSSLTPAQQQQCFRQQFGLPSSAPN
jgi:predicted signal transduction protein with EAL and GGDEF domain